MYGPYETEQAARADSPTAPVVKGGHIEPNTTRLQEVCAAAGVELGAFDARIVAWLANWEDTTVQVVAGLISRAYQAGKGAAGEPGCDACREIGPRATAPGTSGRDWCCESCGTVWRGRQQ